MRNTLKILFIISIIGMLLLTSCGKKIDTNDEDLSDLDKEIKALQEELKNTQPEEVMVEDKSKVMIEEHDEVPKQDMKTLTVQETDLVNLVLKTSDEDNDKLVYTYSTPLDKNGKWQTKYGDAGEYHINVKASDGKLTTEQNVLLIVKKKNEAPKIDPISDIFVKEGQAVKVSPKVTDVNNDEITLKYSSPLDDQGMWETDHTSAGKYDVTLTASDGQKESKYTFKVNVEDVNMLPEISGVEDITIDEGESVTIKPTITDVDKDTIKVYISQPVGDDGVWQTTYTDNGVYKITITADDGKGKSSKEITLTVRDINRPPQIVDISLG